MQLRRLAGPLITVGLVTLTVGGVVGGQGSAEDLVARAKALKAQGQFVQAQALLEKALQQSPDDVAAHYVLAWVLAEQDDREGAADHFRRVVELAPEGAQGQEARTVLARLGAASGSDASRRAVGTPSASEPEPSADPPLWAAVLVCAFVVAFATWFALGLLRRAAPRAGGHGGALVLKCGECGATYRPGADSVIVTVEDAMASFAGMGGFNVVVGGGRMPVSGSSGCPDSVAFTYDKRPPDASAQADIARLLKSARGRGPRFWQCGGAGTGGCRAVNPYPW